MSARVKEIDKDLLGARIDIDDDVCARKRSRKLFARSQRRDCYVANRVPIHDWSVVLRRHPRGGVESSQLEALHAAIGNVVLTDQRDSWTWSLDVSLGFSVASVRSLVDAHALDVDSNATCWIRCIPIKINEDVESVNHIFFSCEMAKALWDLFAKWWELDIPFCDNIFDWFFWLDSLKVSNKVRSFIEGVGGTLMWSIWNYRKRLVFSSSPPKKALLWNSVVSQSFLWISSRNPKCNLNWIGWLQNPLTMSASLGDHGLDPFILLKVVVLQDLWIWHALFDVYGANNDMNAIRQSSIFNDLKDGKATKPCSNVAKRIRYKNVHEAARKYVK
nr:RNA-directed DNA polymerase, eukaryota, reverse transcriptase zinc-binding domain protein [Tanacetum cinerariifolium]GEY59128.1 RNA-directed DNA polymerase, eukaryota, reverse transcriptase zinc-binding domain protein [Tanacetum cinerariifolium]